MSLLLALALTVAQQTMPGVDLTPDQAEAMLGDEAAHAREPDVAQEGRASENEAPSAPGLSKHELKITTRRVERMGELYESMGRCVDSMSPIEVEGVLRRAQSDRAAGAFLLRRFEKGFRRPKGDDWCAEHVAKASARI